VRDLPFEASATPSVFNQGYFSHNCSLENNDIATSSDLEIVMAGFQISMFYIIAVCSTEVSKNY
jgi:hypothetical protein